MTNDHTKPALYRRGTGGRGRGRGEERIQPSPSLRTGGAETGRELTREQ